MKKLLLAMTVAMAAMTANASTQWTLQSKDYTVDTLYHIKIGPGTTQTALRLGGAQALRVYYTTTDLTNPYVDIRVTKGSKKYTGCQTLSAQQKAYDRAGARYFAGVNADFFGNSAPIGSTVVDGEVINVATGWVNWYMTDDKKPHIAALGYKGTVTTPVGSHNVIINAGRGENMMVVYNKSWNGSNTGTNAYGYEVSIQPFDGSLGFSGQSRYTVTCNPVGAGSMAIPTGQFVLSGHGTAAEIVRQLQIGDEVSLDLYPGIGNVTQMASGQPIILQNGETLNTQNALDHLTALNPRTAVGYNADGTKLVLLVVDGRRAGTSVGVVSKVLADIMREVGCSDAMNFDGGGSSELYTSAFGVRNQPSDGTERAVTNAAWCVATAPDDNVVAEIAYTVTHQNLPKYGFYKPQFYGYNKYGVLIDTNLQGVKISAPEGLGVVMEDGETLFANGSGTHALTATYNGATTTIPVTIGAGQPKMRLAQVIVDPYHNYTAEVTATVDDLEMPIDNAALTWSTDNDEVATVDAAGVIRAYKEGNANITGSVENFTGTLPVTVQIPAARHINIDAARDLANWSTSKTSIKTLTVSPVDGDADAFALTYTVSSTRGTKIGVKPNQPNIYAIPDSVHLVVNPGDANVTKVTVEAGPAGERPTAVNYEQALVANQDNIINIPVADFVADPNDFINYPLAIGNISFYVGDAVSTGHTITVRKLQSTYNAVANDQGGVDNITIDGDNILDPNAPGTLYDLQGRPVDRATATPGLYILRQGNRGLKVRVL